MNSHETTLVKGHSYQSAMDVRMIGDTQIGLAVSSSTDMVSKVFSEQMIATADGEPVLRKTFRADPDGGTDLVLEWSGKLGNGTLVLHGTTKVDGDKATVALEGTLDGRDLAPTTATFMRGDKGPSRDGEAPVLTYADRSDLPDYSPDETVAHALADYGEMIQVSYTDGANRNACVAACTAAAMACAVACAALTGPAFALCGKGCVVAQSACVAYCAT